MKRNQKDLWKKVANVATLVFMGIALTLGIVFSVLKVDNDLGYGISYNGGLQASVQVIRRDEKNNVSNDQIAEGLTQKLSPFFNLPITVSYTGKDRISVIAGKDIFPDRNDFKNRIQSTGGMFVLSRYGFNEFNDLYTDSDALSAVGADTRIQASNLFTSQVQVDSLEKGTGRAPFLHLGLEGDQPNYNFSKIVDAISAKHKEQEIPIYYFVTDLQTLIDQLVGLYSLDLNNDNLIKDYFNNVIKPAQDFIANKDTTSVAKETIRAVFSGLANWIVPGQGGGNSRATPISLVDKSFSTDLYYDEGNNKAPHKVSGINNWEDLKYVLNGPGGSFDRSETNTIDYFLYKPDANKEDFEGIYKDDRVSDFGPNLGKIQSTFSTVTNFFLDKVLLTDKEAENKFLPLNQTFKKYLPSIEQYFIFNGLLWNNQDSNVTIPNLTGRELTGKEIKNGTGFTTIPTQSDANNRLSAGLYVPTTSISAGQVAVAAIKQNALGISYRVESIVDIEPTISQSWMIISVIFLGIIVVLLLIYLLFVYRLLGLFTLIIAVTTASLMLVLATFFSISVGPQLIMALFLVIGLIVDLSLILYNSLADRMYQDKQAVKTAFKIANKETIGLSIDAIIVALVPNIVMFWVSQGALKSFATIATIGVFFALIFGIIILRFATWLVLKLKSVQETQALLPINTNYNLKLSFKEQFLVNKYSNYLEKHENKEKYSSKELLKIKRATEKLQQLNQSLDTQRLANLEKLKVSDQKETIKLQKQIEKYQKRKDTWSIKNWSFLGIGQKFKTHYDLKIEELKSIIDTETLNNASDENKDSVAKKVRILRTEHRFNKTGLILTFIIIGFSILGAVIGFTVGPNWSPEFGNGQQFVVYGQDIKSTYDNVMSSQPPFNRDSDNRLKKKAQEIRTDKNNAKMLQDALDQLNNAGSNGDNIASAQKNVYIAQATQLQQLYSFIINNDLYDHVDGRATKINLANWNIQIIKDYDFINPTTGEVTNNSANKVAITINSTATNRLSRSNFRRMLAYLSNPRSNPWADDQGGHRTENGGVVAYDLSPYTSTKLIKQILIVFGILLLALIIYVVIRFKWTYYVALALGLILTFAFVIAATILFRIPISLELLSGMALLISFVTITMTLVLGRGKALLSVNDKKSLMTKFGPELEQSVLIREKKQSLEDKLKPFKDDLKANKKKIKKLKLRAKAGEEVNLDQIDELFIKQKEIKKALKNQVQENKAEFKAFKAETKVKIHLLARKNFFFKEIYLDLIKFTFRRVLTIGMFYILTAIVLLVTLAPMFGMGLTVLLGIVTGFVITLFLVIPLWVILERYRLRTASGFKVYMNNIKVSYEEQIVSEVND